MGLGPLNPGCQCCSSPACTALIRFEECDSQTELGTFFGQYVVVTGSPACLVFTAEESLVGAGCSIASVEWEIKESEINISRSTSVTFSYRFEPRNHLVEVKLTVFTTCGMQCQATQKFLIVLPSPTCVQPPEDLPLRIVGDFTFVSKINGSYGSELNSPRLNPPADPFGRLICHRTTTANSSEFFYSGLDLSVGDGIYEIPWERSVNQFEHYYRLPQAVKFDQYYYDAGRHSILKDRFGGFVDVTCYLKHGCFNSNDFVELFVTVEFCRDFSKPTNQPVFYVKFNRTPYLLLPDYGPKQLNLWYPTNWTDTNGYLGDFGYGDCACRYAWPDCLNGKPKDGDLPVEIPTCTAEMEGYGPP